MVKTTPTKVLIAVTFLLAASIAFLRRFDAERLAPDEEVIWHGWLQAVALLGLRELEPAVMAAKILDLPRPRHAYIDATPQMTDR